MCEVVVETTKGLNEINIFFHANYFVVSRSKYPVSNISRWKRERKEERGKRKKNMKTSSRKDYSFVEQGYVFTPVVFNENRRFNFRRGLINGAHAGRTRTTRHGRHEIAGRRSRVNRIDNVPMCNRFVADARCPAVRFRFHRIAEAKTRKNDPESPFPGRKPPVPAAERTPCFPSRLFPPIEPSWETEKIDAEERFAVRSNAVCWPRH